jgi:hypothetical protein
MKQNIRKTITSKVRGITSKEYVIPLIYRERPKEGREWLSVVRSKEEKLSGGDELTLIEGMTSWEKIRRFRNRQGVVKTTGLRGMNQELYNSELTTNLLTEMYILRGGFCYPCKAPLKPGSKKLKRVNFNGLVLEQTVYDPIFNPDKKEVKAVKWSPPDVFKQNIGPQVFKYLPPDCCQEMEMLMNQILLDGNFNFDKYTLASADPKVTTREYIFFLPASSSKSSPLIYALPVGYGYRRIST